MRGDQRTDHNKHMLQCGTPCRRHRCIQCCIDTQMPLTQQDIQRIVEMGYQPSEFIVQGDGEQRLKNKRTRGSCVFLQNKRCQIYENRPTGCRIYPLVFDESTQQAVVDFLCPFSFEFQVIDIDRQNLYALIKQLDYENQQKLR